MGTGIHIRYIRSGLALVVFFIVKSESKKSPRTKQYSFIAAHFRILNRIAWKHSNILNFEYELNIRHILSVTAVGVMYVSCTCHVRVICVSCVHHVRVMYVSCTCHCSGTCLRSSWWTPRDRQRAPMSRKWTFRWATSTHPPRSSVTPPSLTSKWHRVYVTSVC